MDECMGWGAVPTSKSHPSCCWRKRLLQDFSHKTACHFWMNCLYLFETERDDSTPICFLLMLNKCTGLWLPRWGLERSVVAAGPMWRAWVAHYSANTFDQIFSFDLKPVCPTGQSTRNNPWLFSDTKRSPGEIRNSLQKFTKFSRSTVISSVDKMLSASICFLKAWLGCDEWWKKRKSWGEGRMGKKWMLDWSLIICLFFKVQISFEPGEFPGALGGPGIQVDELAPNVF